MKQNRNLFWIWFLTLAVYFGQGTALPILHQLGHLEKTGERDSGTAHSEAWIVAQCGDDCSSGSHHHPGSNPHENEKCSLCSHKTAPVVLAGLRLECIGAAFAGRNSVLGTRISSKDITPLASPRAPPFFA